mmetsp:Transcript_7394/g.14000  ORF Transcript_7394/g.14000 Transcript_7394/m.14000 type:complete len:1388 (+) Transcript_7394:157-4320(+)
MKKTSTTILPVLWVAFSLHLLGGCYKFANATIPPPPPPPPPLRPPPPLPNGSIQSEQQQQQQLQQGDQGNKDSRGVDTNDDHHHDDDSSHYSEQIMTRQQAEQFVMKNQNYHHHHDTVFDLSPRDKEEYRHDHDHDEQISSAQGQAFEERVHHRGKEEEEMRLDRIEPKYNHQPIRKEGSWIQEQRPPPPPLQRLHQPPPPPPPPSNGIGIVSQQLPQQQRTLLQPISPPPSRPIHRNIPPPPPQSYNRQPLSAEHFHKMQQLQQQQQQQQMGPGSGALVPHRLTRPALQGIGKSILDRFGKSLDAISDVDTIIAKRAQQVMRNVATSSDTIAESVSGAMRKTVFSGIDGVTGIKESIKDQVMGKVSSIFGGAPTIATEARDEWEDDRRRTVSENRRKKILGTERARGSGSGETYIGSGESPLQQHLYGLIQEDVVMEVEEKSKVQEESESEKGNGQGQDQTKVGVGLDEGFTDGKEIIEQKRYDGESVPKPDVNPYAMLAYPAQAHVHDEYHDDESSDFEDHGDTVDPSTFFVSTSSSSGYKRRSSPETFDMEDDEDVTIVRRASKMLFRLPSIKLFTLLSRSKHFKDYDDSAWSDDDWGSQTVKRPIHEKKQNSSTSTTKSSLKTTKLSPVEDILGRYRSSSPIAKKSTANLLSSQDIHQLRGLGRSMGVTDFMALSFMYLFIEACLRAVGGTFSSQQWLIPKSVDEVIMTLRQILSTIVIADVDIFQTWAPFALIAYVLSILTRKLSFELKSDKLRKSISEMIKVAIENNQLFLRLASGVPSRHNLTTTFAAAVQSQSLAVLEIARLRTFVFLSLITFLVLSVAVIRPICTRIFMALVSMITLKEFREWPMEWSALGGELKVIIMSLCHDLRHFLQMEVQNIVSNPLATISLVSVLSTLLLLSQLSAVERRRSKALSAKTDESTKSDRMNAYETHLKNIEKISNVGVSSANRLRIQMENGSIDRILMNESIGLHSRPKYSETVPAKSSALLRKVAFAVICEVLVTLPLGVHVILSSFLGVPLDSRQLANICLMLLFAYGLTKRAIFAAVESSREISRIAPFLRDLSNTVDEVHFYNQATNGLSAPSSNKGLDVSNLWAAHARKRAWACRGVNISCKAGEVVAVLGDESCGKTRLLATIGELLAMPPKRSRTTTIARGNIAIGGIETQKWNTLELKRKIGIMLNDARTISDMSQLYSGLSLGDILRPTCPSGTHEAAIKGAVDLAIEFTGLSKSLLPRLPTRLDTIVTSNEDDLSYSNRDIVILSAGEWSKVLLTKLIAQVILTNDNPMSATSSISRSLLGSVLLLDDVTNNLNELEEIKLIKSLKNSGAATLMTSKRWTIGRFATRIVVIQNGSVVESGTHAELIARGADHSVYAARWAQMMSS